VLSGSAIGGEGVFNDMLSQELARALLSDPDPAWLRFKAEVYFHRADGGGRRRLDRGQIRQLGRRLAAELGVPPATDAQLSETLGDEDTAEEEGTSAVAFEHVFKSLLRRALENSGTLPGTIPRFSPEVMSFVARTLYVVSPNSHHICQGEYAILYGKVNGQAVWAQSRGPHFLYSGSNGFWIVGGRAAQRKRFQSFSGFIYNPMRHHNTAPDKMQGAWMWYSGELQSWIADEAIQVTSRFPEGNPGFSVPSPRARKSSLERVSSLIFTEGLDV